MSIRSNDHVSAERLQALLDGALPKRESVRIEEHLAACSRCSEELDTWRILFDDLGSLPRHLPREGFRRRVLASIDPAVAEPLGARLRRRILAILPAPHPEHPTGERLQDLLDGVLPARQVARVTTHLEHCGTCAAEVEQWSGVYTELGRLPAFAPREGFAKRVMAAVSLPVASPTDVAPATAKRAAARRLPDWRRALAVVGRFVPKTRRAWAAISGVAVTPAVTIGLVVYTLFSHPTLTPQALASFAIWQVGELVSAGWATLSAAALGGAQAFGVDSLVQTLFDAPAMVAGGALVYSVLSALALRVLYKNLMSARRHVRVSGS